MSFSFLVRQKVTLHSIFQDTQKHTRACAFCFSLHLDRQQLAEVSLSAEDAPVWGDLAEGPYWSSTMSEVQALVPAEWVDSRPWATLLGLHSGAERGWDVHFWFWSPQHHIYWPTRCPVLCSLREALAGVQLQTWTPAIITLSQLLLTSLGWWTFHGPPRPRLNHWCHLQATRRIHWPRQ